MDNYRDFYLYIHVLRPLAILFEEHPKGQSPEATAFTSASCELTVSDANPKGCWTEGMCSY